MNLFKDCPIGCKKTLHPSGILVKEGELSECIACGQLLSSCTKAYYENSNKKWNSEEVT